MTEHPLSGITVVALEQAVAVPFATRQLADLGARVIKIERPGAGDFARAYDTTVKGLASHFVWLNRSKESLTLDVKREEGRDVLARLLSRADVFVQNLAPGAADRLGLAPAELRRRFPKLIAGGLSGYGSTGPYADKKAYDLLAQSEVGLVSITGTEETPSKVGLSIADIAGGMYVYSGVLTALLQRARTGEGTTFEVSLFEALGEWMGYAMYYSMGGAPPKRTGASHATIAPYGPFKTSDGEVIFGLHNDREWATFARDVIDRPELAGDARFLGNHQRVANRAAMEAEINRALAPLSTVEVIRRLDRAHIANASMNTLLQFIDHPQLKARGAWRDVPSSAGTIPALVPPVRMEGVEPVMGAIPALGEHTSAILAELGYPSATVDEWRSNGVI
ncbi:MAG TPA: CaiB/BaiF CoA-transferase family protein [Vicinamibacterales bacterium]|nr:CaiB/BaiF CoA-transferase family protein [Vicinamibacterales bacterium]